MDGSPSSSEQSKEAADDLTRGLFVPGERWGWELVPPSPAVPSPDLSGEPVWVEPEPPKGPAKVWHIVSIALGIPYALLTALVGLTDLRDLYVFLIPGFLAGGAFCVGLMIQGHKDIKFDAMSAARWAEHKHAHENWLFNVNMHYLSEQQRVSATPMWYPLSPLACPPRVDVFGGSYGGWRAMLTVLGSSLLATGGRLLVLDFTENHVAEPLAVLAAPLDCPIDTFRMTSDEQRTAVNRIFRPDYLLDGLPARDVSQMVAQVVHTMRRMESSQVSDHLRRVPRPGSFDPAVHLSRGSAAFGAGAGR